jgi:hypothetical protein
MDKTDPPTTFGVFKPVGHIVVAFRTAHEMESAAESLIERGFAPADLVRYTPEEMAAQVDREMHSAGLLASVGQELNLIKAHRELAQNGCSFLVVHAPDDERATQVATIAKAQNAAVAQRYGTFIIEELIEQPRGHTQTFESIEKGLDIDIPPPSGESPGKAPEIRLPASSHARSGGR